MNKMDKIFFFFNRNFKRIALVTIILAAAEGYVIGYANALSDAVNSNGTVEDISLHHSSTFKPAIVNDKK